MLYICLIIMSKSTRKKRRSMSNRVDNKPPEIEVEIQDEDDSPSIDDLRREAQRLGGLISRVEGKISQYTRYLEVSRSISEKTQKLVDLGKSLYDLDTGHNIRI